MHESVFPGSHFILSHVPTGVDTISSYRPCGIATLSRADTIEAIIGIIFTRSKEQSIPQGPKKYNPVLSFQKLMAGKVLKPALPEHKHSSSPTPRSPLITIILHMKAGIALNHYFR